MKKIKKIYLTFFLDKTKNSLMRKTQGGKSRCFLYRVTLDGLYELLFWFEEQRNVELMVALRT